LVNLTHIIVARVLLNHKQLDSAKILNVVAFVQHLSKSPSFRECMFSASFFKASAEILRILLQKTSVMPAPFKEAAVREVFYLVFMYLGMEDGLGASNRSCWHPFLAELQAVLMPLLSSPSGGGSAIARSVGGYFPFGMLCQILTEVLTPGTLCDFGEMVRVTLTFAAKVIVTNGQSLVTTSSAPTESDESLVDCALRAKELESSLSFVEKCLRFEKEAIEARGLAQPSQTREGEVEERKGNELWGSFPFADLVSAITSMAQARRFASVHREIESVVSWVLIVWPEKGKEEDTETTLFNEALRDQLLSLLTFAQERLVQAASLADKLASLQCIQSVVSSPLVHTLCRSELLFSPWNQSTFQDLLLALSSSSSSSMMSPVADLDPEAARAVHTRLSTALMRILCLYGEVAYALPGWLTTLVRGHRKLLDAMARQAADTAGDDAEETFKEALDALCKA